MLRPLRNAHKYSPDPASPITVRATRAPSDGVVFAVETTGCCIADEDLPQIFTRVFSARIEAERGGPGALDVVWHWRSASSSRKRNEQRRKHGGSRPHLPCLGSVRQSGGRRFTVARKWLIWPPFE